MQATQPYQDAQKDANLLCQRLFKRLGPCEPTVVPPPLNPLNPPPPPATPPVEPDNEPVITGFHRVTQGGGVG